MTLHISREQARRFLATYHFTPTDLPGVFERLGTVQYDPLNPVGRNPDLVLQARVPGYRVDDWQELAYTQRTIFDAWDKQACLVPTRHWSALARVRELHRPYHDREILQAEPDAAATILAAIDERGPLSSAEFESGPRSSMADQNSWYGLSHNKRLLRSMWACGLLVTHHRRAGRHYYDRPERVIPAQHYNAPLLDEEAYYRWIIARRFQAAGLLRMTAEACIWSACGDSATRKRAIAQLVAEDRLTEIRIGDTSAKAGRGAPYYIPTNLLSLLDAPLSTPRVLFLGPLDSIVWDRKGVQQIFGFDYAWEVYKPAEQRRWGYYVLPVFYGDRFIARVDSRLEGKTWTISRWWWEPDITPDAPMLDALSSAVETFLDYLRADAVAVAENVDKTIRDTLTTIA